MLAMLNGVLLGIPASEASAGCDKCEANLCRVGGFSEVYEVLMDSPRVWLVRHIANDVPQVSILTR